MSQRSALKVEISDHRHLENQDVLQLLRRLGSFDVSPRKIVSLHLQSRWQDEQQRERVRLFVKQKVAQLWRAEPALGQDLAHAESFTDGLTHRAHDEQVWGVVAFFCAARDIDLVVHFARTLPLRLHAGPRPLFAPLVRAVSVAPPVLIVLAGRGGSRIWEVGAGLASAQALESLTSDVPGRHHMGGWSQLRFQHHIDDHLAHHLQEVATHLERRFDELLGPPLLLVGGPEPTASALEQRLSPRLGKQVVRFSCPPGASDAQVLSLAQGAVGEVLATQQARLVRATLEQAAGGGRGVAGLTRVLEATNHSRIERLVVHERFHAEGIRCRQCGMLRYERQDFCDLCGGPAEPVALEDALLESAAALDAPVTLTGEPQLPEDVGVAALLRW